uniref:INO80 complex subunit E n=1 Tax=Echeneis naucrates TaxID=173247 RepID=A0A665VSZ6_ECHNA
MFESRLPTLTHAAAAAFWLLAVLGPGLSLPAEHSSESDFTLCSHCFYRQTPPQGASAGPLLRPLCHRLPRGQAFATLTKPSCDTAVYSAFHLSHGWMEREGVEAEELEEDGIKVAVPALLRGGRDSPPHLLPTDSPLQHWDVTVTALVLSSISPECNALGGDLYILTGVGGLTAAENGAEECQTGPLWSAVCCTIPQGKGGFSVGLIRETGEEERQVSMKQLEELLGVTEMFSDGCGEADVKTAGAVVGHHSEGNQGNIEEMDADTPGEETGNGVEEQHDVSQSEVVTSESSKSSAHYETVEEEQETDTNSSSVLVYILSTTLSILKAPLRPVVSTVLQLPAQMTYVLQEELGVLASLPGDTYSLLHLLTSDLLSWTGSAAELLLDVGGSCCSGAYYCSSSILGALMSSCHIGATGLGTLAGDTVGVFGDVMNNTWCVTKFFGGRLWELSKGYVGTIMSEMGGQAQAVGGGFGKLAWRGGSGVGNVFWQGGGLIVTMVDMLTGAMREGYGQESE